MEDICYTKSDTKYSVGNIIYIYIYIYSCRYILFMAQTSETPSNECPGYETKQSDGETPVILERWGMWSTPSLSSLTGPLCLKW